MNTTIRLACVLLPLSVAIFLTGTSGKLSATSLVLILSAAVCARVKV